MPKNKKWSAKHDSALKRMYGIFPVEKIAAELKRSELEVLKRCWDLGIPPVERWEHVLSLEHLSNLFNLPVEDSLKLAQEHLEPYPLYPINEPLFVVDTSYAMNWIKRNRLLLREKGGGESLWPT